MKVLVTGGAGYIGSHACKALRDGGFEPITFDNLRTGWRNAVKFGPFEQGDLLNRADLDRVFETHKPVAVMHFAALSQVAESIKFPGKYWHNNVLGSLNLIEATVDHHCKNFICSSTCANHGEQENVVMDETAPQTPINAYGASHLAVDKILRDFEVSAGLRHVIFRYFNVAGADPSAEVGEFHEPETHLIPLILDAIKSKSKDLTIFGTNYETPDGTCIRDYVHVSDLADAHMLGLKWLRDGRNSRVFNLGTGDGFSVRQVIDTVFQVTNSSIPITEGPRRVGDCTKLVSGSNLAKTELGWNSERSNLVQMVHDAWRWHQVARYLK